MRDLTFLEKLSIISTTHSNYDLHQSITPSTSGYSSSFLGDQELVELFSNITFNTEKLLITNMPMCTLSPPLELLRNNEGVVVLQTKMVSVMTQRYGSIQEIIDSFNNFLSGGRNREILLYSIEKMEFNGVNYLVRYEKLDWDYLTDYSYYKNGFIDFKLRKYEFRTT